MGFGSLNQYEFIYLFRAVFLFRRFFPLKHSGLSSLLLGICLSPSASKL